MHLVSRTALWCFPLAVALMAGSARAQSKVDNSVATKVYQRAKAAGVEVLVEGHLSGSGWFADKSGLVMTAAHVIEKPGRRLEINSPSLNRLPAKVIAVDLGHDLALLKVELNQREAPALNFAQRMPAPGTEVYCFGAPLYRHGVLLDGKVACESPAFEYYEEHYVETLLFAATIPSGMSGGPWLNSDGEVLGVQSGVMSQGGVPVGIAFVAPLAATQSLFEHRQTAATPTMGAAVEELWQQDGKALGRFPPQTDGLVLSRLQDDGPAARGGLKKDDLIISADGKPVRLIIDVQRAIIAKRPGDSVELGILNPDGAGDHKVTVKLGALETAWPKSMPAATAAVTGNM